MSAFNHAVAAAADMLAKLSHLDRMPGGGDALAGLSVEIDGTDEAIRITWAKPDAARKVAGYKAELAAASRLVAASAGTAPESKGLTDAEKVELNRAWQSGARGPWIFEAIRNKHERPLPSPPAPAPPPCEDPETSAPAAFPLAAAGDALPSLASPSGTALQADPCSSAPDREGNEPSGADLSRVPSEDPAQPETAGEPPAGSNRGLVLAAWRAGAFDAGVIAARTGLGSQQVIMALKGLRAAGLIPKASEVRSEDRPGCAMHLGESAAEAALRLRAEGFGWGAIAKACGYKSADVAQVCVSRHKSKLSGPFDGPPSAAAPEVRKAHVDAVLERIGLGAERPKEAADAPALDEAVAPAPAPTPVALPDSPAAEASAPAWDDSILLAVKDRDDGRLDVLGPAGSHIASPAVGLIIGRLAGGDLLGMDALAPAAGVKPAEVPSLQSAVRLVCNRVGRALLVVQGIGWRIARCPVG